MRKIMISAGLMLLFTFAIATSGCTQGEASTGKVGYFSERSSSANQVWDEAVWDDAVWG